MYYLNTENENMLSGFISAISIIANTMEASEHYSLETSSKKITLKYCQDKRVIVCCVTEKKVKEKKVLEQLNIITRLIDGFFESEIFDEFCGDMEIFEDLEIEIMALKDIQLVQPVIN